MLHQTYADRPPVPPEQRPQIDPMSADQRLLASQRAYENFFRATYPPLAIQLHAVLGNREEAHRAAYLALRHAARRWNEVGELANPASWVRQRANATIRRQARLSLIRNLAGRRTSTSSPAQPGSDIAVLDALLSLPDVQRRALIFIHLGRLSVDQLALEEHINHATVLSRLAYGTAALGHRLNYDSAERGEVSSEPWATTEINDWAHRQLSHLAYQLRPTPGTEPIPTVSHRRWSTNATIGVVAGVLAVVTIGIGVTTQLGASSYAPSAPPRLSATIPTSRTALPAPPAVVPSAPVPAAPNSAVPAATQAPVAQAPARSRAPSSGERPTAGTERTPARKPSTPTHSHSDRAHSESNHPNDHDSPSDHPEPDDWRRSRVIEEQRHADVSRDSTYGYPREPERRHYPSAPDDYPQSRFTSVQPSSTEQAVAPEPAPTSPPGPVADLDQPADPYHRSDPYQAPWSTPNGVNDHEWASGSRTVPSGSEHRSVDQPSQAPQDLDRAEPTHTGDPAW